MSAPPGVALERTNSLIRDAVNQIAEGKSGIFTAWVNTTSGVNMALAKKVKDDVHVVAYFGKKWGEPIEAGVALQVHF